MKRIVFLHFTLLCILCFVSVFQVEAQYVTYSKYSKTFTVRGAYNEPNFTYNVYKNGYYKETRTFEQGSWQNISKVELSYDSLRLMQNSHWVDTTKLASDESSFILDDNHSPQLFNIRFINRDSLEFKRYKHLIWSTPITTIFSDSVQGIMLPTNTSSDAGLLRTKIIYTTAKNIDSLYAKKCNSSFFSVPLLTIFVDKVSKTAVAKFNFSKIKDFEAKTVYTTIKNCDSLDVQKYLRSLSVLPLSVTFIDTVSKNTVKVVAGIPRRKNCLLEFKPSHVVCFRWDSRQDEWFPLSLYKYTYGTELRSLNVTAYYWNNSEAKWKLNSQSQVEYNEQSQVVAEQNNSMDWETHTLLLENIIRNTYEHGLLAEKLVVSYNREKSIQSMYKKQYLYGEHGCKIKTIQFKFDNKSKTWVPPN